MVALFFVWLATRNDAKPADPTAGISISAAQRKKIETKPTITVPKVAPKTFEIKDLVEGSGAEAKDGDTLDVRYVGVSMLTGKEFDSSWKVSKDNTFQVTPLGTASVIRGWNEGLKGMKVGGRRQLILPPAFAYGDQGQGADIKANDTLVFVVDLMKLTRPPK